MVEVLKSTFEEHLPLIESSIKSADFIAVDTEFTGLEKSAKERTNLFDTTEERYQKMKCSMSEFTILQIGLSAFRRQSSNSYLATTFNFYLYPPSFGPVDVRFLVQASSFQFLCKYDFDFNKYVYDGIPYLNKPQIFAVKKYLHARAMNNGKQRVNEVDEDVLQAFCSRVAEWLVQTENDQSAVLEVADEEIPELEYVKSFILRAELRERFKNIWISVLEGQQRIVRISKLSKMQMKNAMENEQDKEKLLDNLKGFTRVFKMLKGGVPIIGHNMFLDLLLMYDKFHEPLPDTFEEFKKEMQNVFPYVYDTKHICNNTRKLYRDSSLINNSSLGMLYQSLSSPEGQQFVIDMPSVVHATDNYKGKSLPHEAGYDAYMCGFVFLRLSHILTFLDVKSTEVRPCRFSRYLTEMKPYRNKINIIRGNVHYVRLDGPDPPSDRTDLLFVQSKDPSYELHPLQLIRWFSRYGTVDVQVTNSQRALVATTHYKCSKDILKAFRSHQNISVTKYNKWKHSPVIRKCMWAGAILSGGACLLALLSSRKKD